MDEKERSELDEVREGASDDAARDESAPDESASEQDAGMDAAKLSDEEATLAARAFLGTAEPEEEVSVDEAKSLHPSPSRSGLQPRRPRPSRLSTPDDAGTSSTRTRVMRTR
jgi:hypothetical protein